MHRGFAVPPARTIPGKGWQRDLPDHRDWLYAAPFAATSTVEPLRDLRPLMPPVYQQGQLGSCTANGIAACLEFDAMKEGLTYGTPSRLFIYYNERAIEGNVASDSGAQIRDGIKTINIQGACPEAEWPYDISKFAVTPPPQAYTDALQHRAVTYLRLTPTLDQLKGCLSEGYPFVFGFTVYESFESADVARTGIVPLPGPRERVLGGHCLSGDTQIPLLNGTSMSIAEMAQRGGEYWLYSCDSDGNVVPGRAHSARLTGHNRDTVRVTLDSGEVLSCTPDHRILMRDGTYREAGELHLGDSLMPLYRQTSIEKGMAGYERVFNPATKKWRFTHRLVAAAAAGGRYSARVVHHADFDKRNNDPSNLVPMSWEEHMLIHNAQMKNLREYAKSEQGRENSRQFMKSLWANPEWAAKQRERLDDTKVQRGAKSGGWKDKEALSRHAAANGKRGKGRKVSPESVRKAVEARKASILSDPEKQARQKANALRASQAAAKKPATEVQRSASRRNVAIALQAKKDKFANNHKVVSVERGLAQPVYDLTVDEFHNFAIGQGIFVHNCMVGCGHDDSQQRFLVRNSYGTAWGMDGYCTMPYSMVTNPNVASDFWTIHSCT